VHLINLQVFFVNFFLADFLTTLPFFCFSAAASNPKGSRQRVEEETVEDDAATKRDVSSVAVDPLPSSSRATPGQTPPSASRQLSMVILGAPPRQVSSSTGKPTPPSTLGAAPVPKVLKVKKLDVKKSSL
jgi:hypothetical protein